MRYFCIIFFILLLSVASIFAQENYRVGDKVEFECNCFGPTQWVNGTIEEVQGNNTYRIRYGNGRYDYQNSIGTNRIRRPSQGVEIAKQKQLYYQFLEEAAPYREAVFSMMMVHDENLVAGNNKYGPPVNSADWAKTISDLTALDNLCRTKYAGMKNDPNSPWKNDLNHLPATWCEIAARRNEYQQQARNLALSQQLTPFKNMYLNKLNEMLNDSESYISYDYQLLMFEPEKWKADFQKKSATTQTNIGANLPDSFFSEIILKSKELKEKTEREAPNRSFKVPPYNDAVIENLIRGRYATQLKGTQIVKIGMDYTTWKVWKNSLGIPTSQTKVGRVLVKVPNRPFCQEQEFVVVKEYLGGGKYSAMKVQNGVGGAGLFMSCN